MREVPRVEAEAQPQPEAVDVPRAEHTPLHQRGRPHPAEGRIPGEH